MAFDFSFIGNLGLGIISVIPFILIFIVIVIFFKGMATASSSL